MDTVAVFREIRALLAELHKLALKFVDAATPGAARIVRRVAPPRRNY